MADLEALEDWVAPLLARLEPAARRRLAMAVARDLRRDTARHIAAQQAPDGTSFAPRKVPLRDALGAIRKGKRGQDMFTKLRAARHLQAQATPSAAEVGFAGRTSRIARVHQEGLRDRVNPDGLTVKYPVRQLLGITDAQVEHVRDLLLKHLTA